MIREALQAHTLFRFITLLLAVGFQIIVVKVLTPGSYAAYAILLATLLVGERLLSFGIGRTVLRFVPALVLKQDRSGIKVLALRLGLLRVGGLILFLLALTSSRLLIRITPSELTTRTLVAFGVWFVAYTLLTDANAVAQSLIAHRAAALAAAADAFCRTASLTGDLPLIAINRCGNGRHHIRGYYVSSIWRTTVQHRVVRASSTTRRLECPRCGQEGDGCERKARCSCSRPPPMHPL